MWVQVRRRLGVGCLLATLLGGPLAPAVSAALPMGGGAGIVVEGSHCTLGTIGRDNAGDLIGFTAAHCGASGAEVVAEGANSPIGQVVAVNGSLDYEVIKFDSSAVAPTTNVGGFLINGIGPDPDYRQPACRVGAASGVNCGSISSLSNQGPNMSLSRAGIFQPGDDGGPVTSNDELVAIVLSGKVITPMEVPPFAVAHLLKFSAILADVNGSGGAGAGFVPVLK